MKNKKVVVKKGFTLIELLLVIAIIGILAGTVYAMIGNSDNSKRKAVLSTAKSIMPYAQECSFKGNDLSDVGRDSQNGGGVICADSVTTWPKIGISGCVYSAIEGERYEIDCSSVIDAPQFICCDVKNGTCYEGNSCP